MTSLLAEKLLFKPGRFLKERLQPTPVRLIIIVAFLQSLITAILELQVLETNNDILQKLKFVQKVNSLNYRCVKNIQDGSEQLLLITWENRVFIVLQIWQFFIVLSAILNMNTVSVIAVSCTMTAVAIYSVIQSIETVVMHKRLTDYLTAGACVHWDELSQTYRLYSFQIPMTCLNVGFAIAFVFLAWKCYRHFGWSIYHTIGGSYQMHHLYGVFLVFCTLLQLDLFFVIAQQGIWIRTQMIMNSALLLMTPRWYEILNQVATGITPLWLLLGWGAAYIESYILMTLFVIYGGGLLFNQILSIVLIVQRDVIGTWWFIFFLGSLSIIFTFLTLFWAVKSMVNFNRGLKPLLRKKSPNSEFGDKEYLSDKDQEFGRSDLKRGDSGSSNGSEGKRWAIDDE